MGYLVIVSNRSRRGSKWVDQDRSQLGRGENGCQPSQPRYVNVILMHMLYKMFITTYGCILHAYRGCQNYFFPAGTCINYMCVGEHQVGFMPTTNWCGSVSSSEGGCFCCTGVMGLGS